VCAQLQPVEQRLEGGRRVQCWLHGPAPQIPEGGEAPLEREAIGVADEA
jgi:peptide/nickel transport system ATP-binding protein